MSKFPEFYLETNQIWGMITNEQELERAFRVLNEAGYSLFKIYSAKPNEHYDFKNFGTRIEHSEFHDTLFEYLDENGVDITPWLKSVKTEA